MLTFSKRVNVVIWGWQIKILISPLNHIVKILRYYSRILMLEWKNFTKSCYGMSIVLKQKTHKKKKYKEWSGMTEFNMCVWLPRLSITAILNCSTPCLCAYWPAVCVQWHLGSSSGYRWGWTSQVGLGWNCMTLWGRGLQPGHFLWYPEYRTPAGVYGSKHTSDPCTYLHKHKAEDSA